MAQQTRQDMILEATRIHMPNLVEHVLLGDIGATNARFALLANGKLNAINSFEVAKFGQFTDVVANLCREILWSDQNPSGITCYCWSGNR